MKRLLAALCALLIATPAFAGSMTLLGAGKLSSGGGGSTSTFVSYANYEPTGSTDTMGFTTTNVVAGDILLLETIVATGNTPAFTPNGSGVAMAQIASDNWTAASNTSVVFWKALTGPDITNGIISGTGLTTGAIVSMAVFRGGTTVLRKGFSQSTPNGSQSATLVLTGYAQTQGTAVNMECTRVGGGTVSYTVTIPSPFITPADQQNSFSGPGVGSFFTCDVFHAASNLSATTYTFSGYPTTGGGNGQAATLLEIH